MVITQFPEGCTGTAYTVLSFCFNCGLLSQVAAPMLPVGDPAMLITVNFFYGNVFYIVRKAKLAWLHLVQP